jgi:hypothetical protein
LHGSGRRQETPFMIVSEMPNPGGVAPTGQTLTVEAPAPGVGWL